MVFLRLLNSFEVIFRQETSPALQRKSQKWISSACLFTFYQSWGEREAHDLGKGVNLSPSPQHFKFFSFQLNCFRIWNVTNTCAQFKSNLKIVSFFFWQIPIHTWSALNKLCYSVGIIMPSSSFSDLLLVLQSTWCHLSGLIYWLIDLFLEWMVLSWLTNWLNIKWVAD